MIQKISRMVTRTYSDSQQTTTYVEWVDENGKHGTTSGNHKCSECGRDGLGEHMQALIARGQREGVKLETEIW